MRNFPRPTLHGITGLYAGTVLLPLMWRGWLIMLTFYAASRAADTLLNRAAPQRDRRGAASTLWPRMSRWTDIGLLLTATSALALASFHLESYTALANINMQPLAGTSMTFCLISFAVPILYFTPRLMAQAAPRAQQA